MSDNFSILGINTIKKEMIMIALNSCTFVEDTKSLQESQKKWCDEDTYKTFDFTRHNFWITSDDGVVGHGFDTVEDAIAWYASEYGAE